MSLKTPLKRVQGRGAGRSGTEHFWMQRLTAIANIPLVVFLLGAIVMLNGADWARVTAAFRHPLFALAMALATISVFWHMRLGLQVVIDDYVHGEGRRIGLLLAVTLLCAGFGGLALLAILKMAVA